jgi:hypothetical protein
MTEAEWLAASDPEPMWVYLHYNGGSFRKLRLLACACLRRILHLLVDERCRTAVQVAERDAEGLATEEDIRAALSLGLEGWGAQAETAAEGDYGTPLLRAVPDAGLAAYHAIDADWQCIGNAAHAVAYYAATAPRDYEAALRDPAWVTSRDNEVRMQVGLIRCIFGNPFHRPSPPTQSVLAWNDGTVLRIAVGVYEERHVPEGTLDNGRLGILADALLDAGCDNEELIQHLRSEGPHVRGCWGVDLVLGKS